MLQWLYDKIQGDPSINKLPGWGGVSHLYQQALLSVKENQLTPGQEAIILVRDQINEQYNCNMLDSDITNIVLSAEPKTFREFQAIIADSADPDEFYVTSTWFTESCNKFMQCKTKKDSSPPHITCQNELNTAFQEAKVNLEEKLSIRMSNYGSDFFQNGNAEDGAFDLLVDVENVGNALFEWFKPAKDSEVLFYSMPQRSDQEDFAETDTFLPGPGEDYPSDASIYGDLDRYALGDGGYPEAGFQCPENIEVATNSFDLPNIENQNVEINTDTLEDIQDNEITQLSEDSRPTNPVYNVEWVGTIGNICAEYQECGNGKKEGTEQCDDGNLENWDGCNSKCEDELCGDGIVNEDEECDDGNNSNTDACLNSCVEASCGDWFVQVWEEECDYMAGLDPEIFNIDHDNPDVWDLLYIESFNGCSLECKKTVPEYCGDGIVNGNEQCDDANDDNTDACLNTCESAQCGDGIIRRGHEYCDDENNNSGDGCSSRCELEESPYCGDGILQIGNGEQCDDGNDNNNDGCLNNCQTAYCWDGYIQTNVEQCDDGNTTSYDCCNNECQNEGFLSPEEMALGDMLAALDNLADGGGPEITEGCFQTCSDLPISDRVLCMVECTCWEVSSPELRDAIDAGAFRLRYCMIPAESVEVVRQGKTIFSIEEIFTVIKGLLMGLRDSGEMVKSVETKEFMESSMAKNDFGNMFAFNINFSFKSLSKGKTKDNTKKQEQITINKDLMEAINNLWEVQSTPARRNKYVVMEDIATNMAYQKDVQSVDEIQPEINANRSTLTEKPSVGNAVDEETALETIEQNFRDYQTAKIAEEIMLFLEINHSFRGNVNEMFEDIYSATSLLRTKIESGS